MMLMNARKTTEYLYQLTQEKTEEGKFPSVVLYHRDHRFQMIDWKLNGHFSRLSKKKIITGKYGEITLAPVLWNGKQLTFYIIGMGDLREPDAHLKGLASGF
jgi:hypothetical protein